jgi:hypothetical protein
MPSPPRNRSKRATQSKKQEYIRSRYAPRRVSQKKKRVSEFNRAIRNPPFLRNQLPTIIEESESPVHTRVVGRFKVMSPSSASHSLSSSSPVSSPTIVKKVKIGRFVVEDDSPKESKLKVRKVGRFTIYEDSPDSQSPFNKK